MGSEDKCKSECNNVNDLPDETIQAETMYSSIMRGIQEAVEDSKGNIKLQRTLVDDDIK